MPDSIFVPVHPSIDVSDVTRWVDLDYRTILIEGYVCGTIPSKRLTPGIEYATKNDVPVFIMSRGVDGRSWFSKLFSNKSEPLVKIGYGSVVNSIRAGADFLENAQRTDSGSILDLIGLSIWQGCTPDEIRENVTSVYCLDDYAERIKACRE